MNKRSRFTKIKGLGYTLASVVSMLVLLVSFDVMYYALQVELISLMAISAAAATVAIILLTLAITFLSAKAYTRKATALRVLIAVLVFNALWIGAMLIMKHVMGFNRSRTATCTLFVMLAYLIVTFGVLYSNIKGAYTVNDDRITDTRNVVAPIIAAPLASVKYQRRVAMAMLVVFSLLTAVGGVGWTINKKSMLNEYFPEALDALSIPSDHDWALDGIPEYDGTCSDKYYCGSMTELDCAEDVNENQTQMQVISRTDASEYEAYRAELTADGFKQTASNRIDDNLYFTFEKGGIVLHTYYTDSTKEVRIIKDVDSASLSDFSYEYKDGTTEFYQYSLLYADKVRYFSGDAEQCGMMYVIKLADNKLYVIDGGMYTQATDKAIKGFYDFCKEITGKESDEKLDVACWFCTHQHTDHYEFFAKFITVYADNINVERVAYNFPTVREMVNDQGSDSVFTLFSRLKQYAPNAQYLKVHSGQKITLASIEIEVLYTHEDAFSAALNETAVENFNDTSSITRIFMDGKEILMLGDCHTIAEKTLCRNYSADTLDCDVLQLAHHGMNYLDTLYARTTSAQILFAPQGDTNSENACGRVIKLLKSNGYDTDNIHFAGNYTYGVSVANGELKLSQRAYVGDKVYDGSLR